MQTLVLPDIHLDVHWAEDMILKHNPERIILLGDYYDPSPRQRGKGQHTAYRGQSAMVTVWLADLIREYGDRVIVLIGNHDAPCLFPHLTRGDSYRYGKLPMFDVGNFTIQALREIEALKEDIALIRSVAQWYYFDEESNTLFSHAGIHPAVFGKGNNEFTITNLDRVVKAGVASIEMGISAAPFGVGKARGGNRNFGGLTWLDFNEEFTPIEGIRQVVGHTIQRSGFGIINGNVGLDGVQTTVGTIENGKFLIIDGDELVDPDSPGLIVGESEIEDDEYLLGGLEYEYLD